LLDLAKGYAVVALAQLVVALPLWPFEAGREIWQSRELWVMLAALLGILGHMYPVWLGFHGGKGVATGAGAFLALDPLVFAGITIIFAIVLLSSRYVSLASMVAAASGPLLFRYMGDGAPFWRVVISIAIAIAVILKHNANIARLARGTENRLGQKEDER
ncbi:MAG: glycerol-3-phosphate acyltransferase, partial [Thermoanaerobaculia bacterium]